MSTLAEDGSTPPPHPERLRMRSIQMLLDVGYFPAVMHVAIAGVLSGVLWEGNNPVHTLAWVLTLSGIVIYQATLVRRWGGSRFAEDHADRALALFSTGALGVGLSWGFAGWFLFPAGDPARQIFLTFVMGGMAMSAVSNQHVHIRTCLFSVVPGMVPLALRYMAEPFDGRFVFGGLLLIYTLVLVSMMRRQWRFAMMAFRLQLENEDLLAEATEQALEIDAARRAADSANAAKSRFLAQASHDLRQPLHAISLYVESLPIAPGDEKSNRIVGRMRQSLDVLSRLFNSLLDVTLLDTGQIKVRTTVFPARDLAEQIRNEFSGLAETAGIDFRIRVPDLALQTDPVLLRRMLQNLCSNAFRHAEGGGVLVSLRQRDGRAMWEVWDFGPGIPEKDQARIFEEFTRLDPARMGGSAGPGLGLGLAIVQRLAGVLQHDVGLASQEGKGTRFSISGIEIRPMAEAHSLKDENATEGQDVLSGVHVLLIDDDQDSLDAGAMLLRKWGCHVTTMLGWEGMPDSKPDIVICDYELAPNFNGFNALDRLHGEYGQDLPAIMISGNSTPELRTRVREASLPLINKPVRPGQIRSALLHAMTGSRNSA